MTSAFKKLPDATKAEEIKAEKIGFTFGELLKQNLPERQEIIFGLGRGEIGIINAVGNAGKTTLLRNLTASLCAGKHFNPFGEFNLPKRVAFIDFEDSLSFIRKDFRLMVSSFTDAEKKNVKENAFFICDVVLNDEDLNLSNSFHLELITKRLKSFKADLIIIDTISSGFRIKNENDNAEIKEVIMKPIIRLAKATKTAVLMSHHIGKSKSEEGQTKEASHKGRGASAFSDLSKLVLNLEKDKSDGVILSCAKVKGKSFEDKILKLDFQTRWFNTVSEKMPELSPYELVIKYFDCGKEYSTSEIVSAFEKENISERSIKNYLKEAIKREDLTKVSHGKYTKVQKGKPYNDCTFALSNNSNDNNDLQIQSKTGKKDIGGLSKCKKCGLEMKIDKDSKTIFCPFGCESFNIAKSQN